MRGRTQAQCSTLPSWLSLLAGDILIQDFSLSLLKSGAVGMKGGLGAQWNCLIFLNSVSQSVLGTPVTSEATC